MDKLCYQDEIKGHTINDIANYYGITVEQVETICQEYGLGNITYDGVRWFSIGDNDKDTDISMFRFYYKHSDISEIVRQDIIKNQPTTIKKIAKRLKLSREKIWAVVDHITLIDEKLYEKPVGKSWFLCYRAVGNFDEKEERKGSPKDYLKAPETIYQTI